MALILLYWDKTDKLGIMLGKIIFYGTPCSYCIKLSSPGLLMMGMVTLFLIVVACMGIDWVKYVPAKMIVIIFLNNICRI